MGYIRGANLGTYTPDQDIYEESVTQKHKLGERLVVGDRAFRYILNSANAQTAGLGAGLSMTSEDTVTVAHGVDTFDVDVTAASIVANQFAEGYLAVDEGTGVGNTYKIRSNDATGGAAGSGKIRCKLYDGLATAWAVANTDVTLISSPYYKAIVAPTDGIIMPIGVPLIGLTASYFAWVQTWGPCGVKVDAATGGGAAIDERIAVLSTNHAGQVMFVGTADVAEGAAVVGECMLDSADHGDDKTEPIFLKITQ